jgi:Phosphotransferase enzyme family
MLYPWNPPRAFSSVKVYLYYYRNIFLDFSGQGYVDELFGCFQTEAKVHLTHGDLLPHNILVEGSKITGILDWETAGYYPEFWEYCQMHDLEWMPPAWANVLARIFPGTRREKETKAVSKILRAPTITICMRASIARKSGLHAYWLQHNSYMILLF